MGILIYTVGMVIAMFKKIEDGVIIGREVIFISSPNEKDHILIMMGFFLFKISKPPSVV